MDLNALKVFIYIVETGSFTNAAKALEMPTSNVSRAVTQLEKQLNCQLLIRTTRSHRLTEYGEIIFDKGKPLVKEMEVAAQQLGKMQNTLNGTLNIAIPSESGPFLLGDALIAFAAKHPQLQLQIHTNLLGPDNLQNNIDIALFFHRGALLDSTMITRKIRSFESIVVAAPSLLKRVKPPKKITDFTTLPCITTSSALNKKPWCFTNPQGGYDLLNISGNFCADSGLLAAKAAIAGLGFAILTKEMSQESFNNGSLVAINLPQKPAALELLLAYPQQKHLSPATRVFIDTLLHYFATLP